MIRAMSAPRHDPVNPWHTTKAHSRSRPGRWTALRRTPSAVRRVKLVGSAGLPARLSGDATAGPGAAARQGARNLLS